MKTQKHGKARIIIVGGGFGGVYTALALEKLRPAAQDMNVTLISRDNYLLITPLLFEAGSGILEPRHTVCPIRPLLRQTRFIVADVYKIDTQERVVRALHQPDGHAYNEQYDQLVLAVGGVTNRAIIPGSEHAMAFKTLSDAIGLRNKVIDVLEQANVETDAQRRRYLLTMVVIGAGLVGVELVGELTEFLRNICRTYQKVSSDDIRIILCEAGPVFLRELSGELSNFARSLLQRRGVDIRTSMPVTKITADSVFFSDGACIPASIVLLCAGVAAHPLLASLDLPKNHGRLAVDETMRCPTRPEIWAIGDCAWIPAGGGKAYPQLAQHALREARTLARNICRSVCGQTPEPFRYQTLGALAALGHYAGVGRVMKVQVRGFLAWWIWRSYYLMQMPRWSRRLRIIIDWTVSLFFHNDVVKLVVNADGDPTAANPIITASSNPTAVSTPSSATH
ncbi:MAG: NAD(P)/FAD-dependent oxidoreductase [Phycisphaerae bacterium]